jgi:hypothetical protein
MAKKKKIEEVSPAVTDQSAPDVSKIPVEINGKTYNLCFEFAELAKAERLFKAQGNRVNLLQSLPEFSFESLREVFPCAAHRFHSELSFQEAQDLVTLQSVYSIALAVAAALGANDPAPAAK